MQYGDVQAAQASQRAVPIPNAPRPQARPQNLAPGAGGPAPLPDHIFGMPSSRPEEPVTDGLGIGPGRGPEALATQDVDEEDDREVVLRWLTEVAGNADARDMLDEIRSQKAQRRMAMSAPAPAPMPMAPIDMATEGAPSSPEMDEQLPPAAQPAAEEDDEFAEQEPVEEDFDEGASF